MLVLSLFLGCFQENLPEVDLTGKVIIPREAATRFVPVTLEDGTLSTEERVDARFIGPVLLGAYSGVETDSYGYPHPEMGPVLSADSPGNTFPYGGTSVGRYDFACYDALACKVVTGRFVDYADTLDYFRMIGKPVVDGDGVEVMYGSTFQQACYNYYDVTSDQEVSFVGKQQFTENADGDFEAEFYMAHTTLNAGMSIWGFMDAPLINVVSPTSNGTFTTCDIDDTNSNIIYDHTITEGEQVADALNFPSLSITTGDWVGDGTTVVETVDDVLVVNLSVLVGS